MPHCPVCASTDAEPLLDLGMATVFCNVQWATREEALAAARGPIELVACRRCGHVFNAAFDPELAAYAPGYENSQHASTVFSGYAERLVERLVTEHRLGGRTIVDIGCGRGDLLRMLAGRAQGRGFGFDPSFKDGNGLPDDPAVKIVNDMFDAERARELRPALVCCRHVLEHVPDPIAFLRGMRDALAAAGSDAVLYLEVPNGSHLFATGGVWDVLYEHYSYFTPQSLEVALRAAGFDPLRIYTDFGDQFLCVDARPRRAAGEAALRLPAGTSPPLDGARRMAERIEHWRQWAAEPARGSRPATVWGAGSKGVMFLNLVGLRADGIVPVVIDQNGAKHGRFVSGTGQQILLPSAESLRGIADVVLMNSIYAREVEERIKSLGREAALLAADR